MVIANKQELIEKLTGVHSSKKSYYVELKQKIAEVSKRNLQLEIINQLGRGIGVEMSLPEIVSNIIPRLQALLSFEALNLYLIDKNRLVDRSVFVVESKDGTPDRPVVKYSRHSESMEIRSKKIGAALWYVLREKKPLVSNNLSPKGCSFPEQLALIKKGISAVVLVPLTVNDRVIAVMELAGKQPFQEEDLPFLEQVADQLAICLENVRLYREAWQRRREWEMTFSAVTDLLIFIDQDCLIKRVNRAACEFFTAREEELLGQFCYRVLYGRESRCNPCLAEQVLQTGKTAYLQSRTRSHRVLDIFAYPVLDEHGKPSGTTYYAKDVTRFVDSIKFVSLGEMSAGVAHELNGPLTAVVGDSQLLLRETAPDHPHYPMIKDIHACGLRCQRIIQNLLTFSRQEEFTFEEVDLNEVVKKTLDFVGYQIEKSKIRLTRKLSPDLPLIQGNAQRLEQVLINLLLNAKDAVESAAPSRGSITVQTRMTPDTLVAVDVVDNGCGIDPARLTQIFNPFYTTKRAGKGTGLGLSVSLGIAQAHGGFIDAESQPGKGSRFSLILPLDTAGQKQKAEEEVPESTP